MAVKQAKCDINILPILDAQPTRRRTAEVRMDILAGMSAGSQPIKLIIKGENFKRVMELMTLQAKPDAELAEIARSSALASEVEGMTVEETAAWVRGNVLDELKEMSGGDTDEGL